MRQLAVVVCAKLVLVACMMTRPTLLPQRQLNRLSMASSDDATRWHELKQSLLKELDDRLARQTKQSDLKLDQQTQQLRSGFSNLNKTLDDIHNEISRLDRQSGF